MNRPQLPVLLYHRVVNSKNDTGKHKIYVYKNRFESQLQYLKKSGFETLTFRDLLNNNNHDWNKKIILSFDDGYEDNYDIAFPLLKNYGFKAVIFLVTKQKDNSWGRSEGEPVFRMMSEKQIREMSDYGIEFGGHTQYHPNLTKVSEEEANKEIEGCKRDIERITQKECVSFAYPFGAVNETVKSIVKSSGYRFGLATTSGTSVFSDDLFEIRRIEVRPQNKLSKFKFKASGYYFQKYYLQHIFS